MPSFASSPLSWIRNFAPALRLLVRFSFGFSFSMGTSIQLKRSQHSLRSRGRERMNRVFDRMRGILDRMKGKKEINRTSFLEKKKGFFIFGLYKYPVHLAKSCNPVERFQRRGWVRASNQRGVEGEFLHTREKQCR